MIVFDGVYSPAISNVETLEQSELMLGEAGMCGLSRIDRRECAERSGILRGCCEFGFGFRAEGEQAERREVQIALIFRSASRPTETEAAIERIEAGVEAGLRHPDVAIGDIGE